MDPAGTVGASRADRTNGVAAGSPAAPAPDEPAPDAADEPAHDAAAAPAPDAADEPAPGETAAAGPTGERVTRERVASTAAAAAVPMRELELRMDPVLLCAVWTAGGAGAPVRA